MINTTLLNSLIKKYSQNQSSSKISKSKIKEVKVEISKISEKDKNINNNLLNKIIDNNHLKKRKKNVEEDQITLDYELLNELIELYPLEKCELIKTDQKKYNLVLPKFYKNLLSIWSKGR